MELFEADLRAFQDDWTLRRQAETTVEGYCRDLRIYEAWCRSEGLGTLSMRGARAYLVHVTKTAGEWRPFMVCRAMKAYGKWWGTEYSEPDPFGDLSYVKEPDAKPQRTTTVADVEAMLDTCEDHFRGVRDRAIVHVLASTAMRRAELSRMMWGDLDLATGVVRVPTTKNGEYRTVRLAKDAQRALRRYCHLLERWECDNMRDRAEYVWASTTRRSAITPNGVGQMITKRSKLAAVDVTCHAFRRGFAVEWLKRGGSETYLRSVAGWKSPEMVKRYTACVVNDEALDMHERLFG